MLESIFYIIFTHILVPESLIPKALDCADVLLMGHNTSAIYEVWPVNRLTVGKPLRVYCDMVTDGGGWTVSILNSH